MPGNTPPPRALWIDGLRGVAILLVMVWHALVIGDDQRVQHGPIWETSVALQGLRMPTLFFLSGLLLPRALEKPVGSYIWGKWTNLVWPYLVWQLIALVQAPDLSVLRLTDWGPHNYLWFMFYLMVYFAVALVLRWMPPIAMLAVALVAFIVLGIVAEEGSQPMRLGIYAVWFFAGAATGRAFAEEKPGFSWDRAIVLFCFLAAGWVNRNIAGLSTNPEANPFVFVYVSVPTVGAAVAAALMFAGHRVFLPVQWVGRHSVIFYTAHFAVQVFVIVALVDTQLGGPDAAVLGFLASVAVCSLLAALRGVMVVSVLFSFPARLMPRAVRPVSNMTSLSAP
ncbi:acyltransferase [Brevibacterium sp. BDJS002]|uniref:acyltransferase family protein n=1 Tax=unclassified Brevibacterium TaxID=2614124 RepID=UPI0010F90A38|nr:MULTISPECIES: acyltransferase [unclassified Brevibacterium]WCE40413.1 acyltransferase [Brevibacterium sp. BDJS002]